jgi:OmpA-OmpF porin, OOP family
MRKAICLLLFVVPGLLSAAGARAQQPKPYIGAGGGSSSVSFNSSDFNLGVPQTTDKGSTGFKVIGGVRINEYFALEAGYVDLGKFKTKYNGGAAGTAELDYKVSGIALSGIGSLPLTQDFSLLGRLGMFASTAKLSLASASGPIATNLAAAGITVGSSDSASATTLIYGAGVQYDFTKNISARIEYENYGEVGTSADTGRATVSLISASLMFLF